MVDQELRGIPCNLQRFLAAVRKQPGHQALVADRRSDNLAGIGIVMIGHVRFDMVAPPAHRGHRMVVQGTLYRRRPVVEQRGPIGTGKGIIAEEGAHPGGVNHRSGRVQGQDRQFGLPHRYLVPHLRQRFTGPLGFEGPVPSFLGQLETVFYRPAHVRKAKGGRIDKLFGKAVPIGIAPFITRPDRLQIFLRSLPVQFFPGCLSLIPAASRHQDSHPYD